MAVRERLLRPDAFRSNHITQLTREARAELTVVVIGKRLRDRARTRRSERVLSCPRRVAMRDAFDSICTAEVQSPLSLSAHLPQVRLQHNLVEPHR